MLLENIHEKSWNFDTPQVVQTVLYDKLIQLYVYHIYYQSQQARITSLYLPFLMVILENKNRLTPKETLPQAAAAASAAPSQPSYSDTGEVSAGGGDRQPGSRPLSSIDSFVSAHFG